MTAGQAICCLTPCCQEATIVTSREIPPRSQRPYRNSENDPLRISEVSVRPGWGKIGITICPGKKDRDSYTSIWDRDLDADLDAVKRWGAVMVVTLIERHEFRMLAVQGLREGVLSRDMVWRHFPIKDVSIPTQKFERHWTDQGPLILDQLRLGHNVLVHCRGGLGRAGMIACRLLTDAGIEPEEALDRVREARPGAVETTEQEDWVLGTE